MRNWLLMLLVAVAGCDRFPRDANGALERVRNGEVHVGVADHVPWMVVSDGHVSGIEAELIEAWARSKLALTQPFVETIDESGKRRKHVLAVTQGESALLLSLDRYLAVQDRNALRARARQR